MRRGAVVHADALVDRVLHGEAHRLLDEERREFAVYAETGA